MGESLVVNGKVIFSSYSPAIAVGGKEDDSCSVAKGGKGLVSLYGIDVATGYGVFNQQGAMIDPVQDNAYQLHGLPLSSLGAVSSVMLGDKINLLAGSRLVGELDLPSNIMQPVSWHEAAKGSVVHSLFGNE